MTEPISCPVCDNKNAEVNGQYHAKLNDNNDYGFYGINCLQCGEFVITTKVINMLANGQIKRHLLSHYIRNQYYNCKVWTTENAIKSTDTGIANLAEIPLLEKADLLLQALAADIETYDKRIDATLPKYIAKSASKSKQELVYIIKMLSEDNLVTVTNPSHDMEVIKVTPKGWNKIEALSKQTNFKQAFVAMWFDDSMRIIYDNAIEPAIRDAGFEAKRIDKTEHLGKICDEIIAEIRRSRFVVADFTGHRGGVYYEAGFAQGLGIPVIWTCKKCCVDDLHFDIRQYNMILWENEEELKDRLYQRIRAVI